MNIEISTVPAVVNLFEGVCLQVDGNKKAYVCHIYDLSDELKSNIRSRLSAICLGVAKSSDDLPIYSYKSTLKEFLRRYNKKDENTKKGMIGELLTHIIFQNTLKNMEPISPLFNMEEASITKGFDIIFRDSKTGFMWITEVKSGNALNDTAKIKNDKLISTAKGDIKNKLSGLDTIQNWRNAINKALLSIEQKNIKKEISQILSDCYQKAENDEDQNQDHNIVLASVVYRDFDDKLLLGDVKSKPAKIIEEDVFNDIIVFSIQKSTYQAVVSFLESEVV
jgi:hypothetical protein